MFRDARGFPLFYSDLQNGNVAAYYNQASIATPLPAMGCWHVRRAFACGAGAVVGSCLVSGHADECVASRMCVFPYALSVALACAVGAGPFELAPERMLQGNKFDNAPYCPDKPSWSTARADSSGRLWCV